MLLWNSPSKQLHKLKIDKSDEHEDEFTCFDTLPNLGLIVTGDKDGLVKIWNCKKQLIREVKFVESVNSVVFLNPEADIIVGHFGNLSRLNACDYLDKKMEVTDQDFIQFMEKSKEVKDKWLKKISAGQKRPCGKHKAADSNAKIRESTPMIKEEKESPVKEAEPEHTAIIKFAKSVRPSNTHSKAVSLTTAKFSTASRFPAHTKTGPISIIGAPPGPPISNIRYNPNASSNTGSVNESQMRANMKEKLTDIR